MKIAVTSTAPDLDAEIDPRFGRAQYLLVVDTADLQYEAIENPNMTAGMGAGIQTAQMLSARGVEAVLTGNCGPNAYQTLSAAGIQICVGLGGRVREAVEAFSNGDLQSTAQPSVPGHFGIGMAGGAGGGMDPGMGMGRGTGRGMGMGRGIGRGTGRGMGMGRGIGRGMGGGGGAGMAAGFNGPIPGPTPPATPLTPEQELQQLKDAAAALRTQLQQMTQRIEELESE
jgi:predicted Fe-Mo cluster-binding NifX family protein